MAYRRSGLFTHAALVVGLAFAAPAGAAPAADRAQAKTTILRSATLTKLSDLDFGDIGAGATPGTVVVTVAGVRTVTGGVTALGGTITAARFAAAVAADTEIEIFAPPANVLLTRVGGTETMTVNALTISGPREQDFERRGILDFTMGGTLRVGAGQAVGLYTGQYRMTVDFD